MSRPLAHARPPVRGPPGRQRGAQHMVGLHRVSRAPAAVATASRALSVRRRRRPADRCASSISVADPVDTDRRPPATPSALATSARAAACNRAAWLEPADADRVGGQAEQDVDRAPAEVGVVGVRRRGPRRGPRAAEPASRRARPRRRAAGRRRARPAGAGGRPGSRRPARPAPGPGRRSAGARPRPRRVPALAAQRDGGQPAVPGRRGLADGDGRVRLVTEGRGPQIDGHGLQHNMLDIVGRGPHAVGRSPGPGRRPAAATRDRRGTAGSAASAPAGRRPGRRTYGAGPVVCPLGRRSGGPTSQCGRRDAQPPAGPARRHPAGRSRGRPSDRPPYGAAAESIMPATSDKSPTPPIG